MIIFDLDGTLADCEHRRHFVDLDKIHPNSMGLEYSDGRKWKPDWKSFYEACDKDQPICPVIKIFDSLRRRNELHIWSGRCESTKQKTLDWFESMISGEHCLHKFHLKMRPVEDYTPDDVLKEKWLDESISQGKTVDFVFDDRPKVVRMWRRRGIFVFDCNQTGAEF